MWLSPAAAPPAQQDARQRAAFPGWARARAEGWARGARSSPGSILLATIPFTLRAGLNYSGEASFLFLLGWRGAGSARGREGVFFCWQLCQPSEELQTLHKYPAFKSSQAADGRSRGGQGNSTAPPPALRGEQPDTPEPGDPPLAASGGHLSNIARSPCSAPCPVRPVLPRRLGKGSLTRSRVAAAPPLLHEP